MKHLTLLKEKFEQRLNLPAVIEPTRAQSAAHVRLMASDLDLQPAGQHAGQTDVPYLANLKITASARLLGGNEKLSLTSRGIALSVRLTEWLQTPFKLDAGELVIDGGLILAGEAACHMAEKQFSGFERLVEDESSSEDRLFQFREDWTLIMTIRVLREHRPPRLKLVQSAT